MESDPLEKTTGQVVTPPKSKCTETIMESKEESTCDFTPNNKLVLENSLQECTPVNPDITPNMIEEEQDSKRILEEEQKKEEIEIRDALQHSAQEQRYQRLQLLLNRSESYATYLLERVKSRKLEEEEKKRKEKKKMEAKKEKEAQKKQEEMDKAADGCQDENTPPDTTVMTRAARVRTPNRKYLKDSESQVATNKNKSPKKNKDKRKQPGDEESNNKETMLSEEELKIQIKKRKLDDNSLSKGLKNTHLDEANIKNDNFSRDFNGQKISDRQPVLLSGGVMRDYQLDGMEWLKGLFEHGINGILADEMGLGKTIQCIGLIANLIQQGCVGPFLVAAPLSTLPNWVSEFKRFTPEIRTILYHGSIQERESIRKRMFRLKRHTNEEYEMRSLPVVISSYEILMRDRPHLAKVIEWKYLIVDEGHRIKNMNCKLIRELKQYNTANRLLLTGTPLQNNLTELWSLLNFLLPDIFDDLHSFQSWFDFSNNTENDWEERVIAQEKEASVLQTLHAILTPFLLRRLKTDVELAIPPKKEVIVYAPLTAIQQDFYRTTLDRSIGDILKKKHSQPENEEVSASGRAKRKSTVGANYQYLDADDKDFDIDTMIEEMQERERLKVEQAAKEEEARLTSKKAIVRNKLQNILMQLRKCCNHPYLIEYPFNAFTKELIIDERIVSSCGKILLLERMLPELKKRGHKVLIFSQMTQMMDIISDYCSLRNWSHSRLDGSMKFELRQEQIDSFSSDPDVFIFLLSTRAGGLGLNLMAADTCIIYDSDWNPQQDLQAQDRCHRIGQTKPVVIYRLITANTVDQRIIERANMKRKLEKMVIHEKNFKGKKLATALSPQELMDLLAHNDLNSAVGDSKEVISDEHLEKLLDRTDMWEEMLNKKSSDAVTPSKASKEDEENYNKDEEQEDNVAFKVVSIEPSTGGLF